MKYNTGLKLVNVGDVLINNKETRITSIAFGVFIVNFTHVHNINLIFSYLTLSLSLDSVIAAILFHPVHFTSVFLHSLKTSENLVIHSFIYLFNVG